MEGVTVSASLSLWGTVRSDNLQLSSQPKSYSHPEGFLVVLVGKKSPVNAGDVRETGSVPGLGIFPGGGHGNPLHYCCLENLIDRGAWQATVRGIAKSGTWLKQLRGHSNPHTVTLQFRNVKACSHWSSSPCPFYLFPFPWLLIPRVVSYYSPHAHFSLCLLFWETQQ